MIGEMKSSASFIAMAAVAGLVIAGATLAPKAARAADLGGDCCADLESRVAELEATTARKGNKKVSLTITGRVAATMTWWNDGGGNLDPAIANDEHSDLAFGDHSGNGPEIIVKGEGKISSDMTAGYYMEVAFDGTLNGSTVLATGAKGVSGSTQVSHEAAGGSNLNNGVNDTYVYLSSKRLGTLQLGRVDNAGDEYFSNFNNAYVAGQEAGRFTGLLLRDVNGKLTSTTFGTFLSTLEPNYPGNGLRYISSNLGDDKNNVNFTASVASENNWGIGANAKFTASTVNVKAGIGYGANSEIDGNNTFLGVSAGIKETTSGLFLEGQWAKRTLGMVGVTDATEWMIQGGWEKNVTGIGETNIWASYNRNDGGLGLSAGSASAHSFQLGIDQTIDSAASHLFLTYENDGMDTDGLVGNASALYADGSSATGAIVNSQMSNSVTAGMSVSF